MRKWILSAVAITALAAGTARAQTSAPAASGNQKALQLMLQKGLITQAEYDAAVVSEVKVSDVTMEYPFAASTVGTSVPNP